MSTSGKSAVFLSYASQDAEAARRLCEALRQAGVEVWFDQNELIGGDAWDGKIRKQIKECALFLPLISAATQARREGYFRLEWKLGAQRTHMMAAGTPFILPVVLDGTRDGEALVPDEFREVQWTRLPAGDPASAFVARVKRLCDTPEHEPVAAGVREVSAFTFAGRNYANPPLLATALVQHWPEAERRWADGSIAEWVGKNSDDETLGRTLREITEAKKLDAGQQLAVALLALNPALPFLWQGEVVTDAWLAAHPERAAKLCESAVPTWLKKLREDNWLAVRAARRADILGTMPATPIALDRARVEQLVFGPAAAIEEQLGALVEQYGGAKDSAIDALLHREELSLGEAVLLLALPHEIFLPAGQTAPRVESPVPAAAPVGESPANAECLVETQALLGHAGPVHGVSFSAGVRFLASSGHDARIVVWDPHTGMEVRRIVGVTAATRCVAFAPNGSTLAGGGGDGSLRIWEVSIGRELRELKGHTGPVNSVAFGPDGRQLVSGGSDRLVIVWDAWAGKELHRLHGHRDWIAGVALSPDGRRVASCSADSTLWIWDAASGRESHHCEGHTGTVHGVAFAPDGRWIASAGADHSLRLWDASTGKEVRQFAGHTRAVLAVTFHPKRPWLVSAGSDHTIRVWHVLTGEEVQRIEAHTNAVRCLDFSRDGFWLASGSSDCSVRVWKLVARESD